MAVTVEERVGWKVVATKAVIQAGVGAEVPENLGGDTRFRAVQAVVAVRGSVAVMVVAAAVMAVAVTGKVLAAVAVESGEAVGGQAKQVYPHHPGADHSGSQIAPTLQLSAQRPHSWLLEHPRPQNKQNMKQHGWLPLATQAMRGTCNRRMTELSLRARLSRQLTPQWQLVQCCRLSHSMQ